MSDKRETLRPPQGAQSRKRKAPIIDLTATEIRSDAHDAGASKSTSGMDEEPSPADGEQASEYSENAARAAKLGRLPIAVLATAVLGIVVGFVLALLIGVRDVPQTKVNGDDLRAQISDLQRQITSLHNRLMATNRADLIEAMSARVAKLENAVANGLKTDGDDITQRVNVNGKSVESLRGAVNALYGRMNDLAGQIVQAGKQADAAEKALTQLRGSVQTTANEASTPIDPAQIDGLRQRIAALEQSTKSLHANIAKLTAAENAARLAMTANALRSAVVGGAPFRAELTAAKTLGADDKVLASLEPFAAKGVPSATSLAQELRASIPAIRNAVTAQTSAVSFFERLQANAGKLVRIRPVTAPSGDDPSDVLVRLETAAALADLSSAVAELAKLPERMRAPARSWIEKVRARQAALAAVQSFATELINATGKE